MRVIMFTKQVQCARHYVKSLTCIKLFVPKTVIRYRCYYIPHFIGEKTDRAPEEITKGIQLCRTRFRAQDYGSRIHTQDHFTVSREAITVQWCQGGYRKPKRHRAAPRKGWEI